MEWFLLTGQPQTGKTTVINKTIESINSQFKEGSTLNVCGFLTDERINNEVRKLLSKITNLNNVSIPGYSKNAF